MPHAVRQKIVSGTYPLSLRRPSELFLILLSILIGAASHLLWDSFTHGGYWPARHFPWFWEKVHFPLIGNLYHFKILQYVSTVFGMLVVFLWCLQWIRTAPVQQHPAGSSVSPSHARLARVLIPAVALLGGLLRAVFGVGHPQTPRDVQAWIVDFVVAAISLTWLELMIWGFTLPARRSRTAEQRDHANVA